MKKTVLFTLVVFLAMTLAAAGRPTPEDRDIRIIKKAVKEYPATESGREARLFKVLVVDARTKKDKVKITLPISVVEALIQCSDDHHLRIHDEDCDIDLKALLAELKKVGPMTVVEVREDHEVVKVWLE